MSAHRLSDRIRWVLWSRVVFLGVMATSAVCLNFVYGDAIQPNIIWAILLGLSFSFLSRLTLYLRLGRRAQLSLAYAQIIGDAILVSFLVKETGGQQSAFTLLYGLNIISAGIVLFRSGAIFSLVLSLAGYTTITYMSGVVGAAPFITRYIFIVSVLMLFGGLVALLFRGREQLVKSLERASDDLRRLMELQSAVVGHIPTGILIISNEDIVIYANPSAQKILENDPTGVSVKSLGLEEVVGGLPNEKMKKTTHGRHNFLLLETVDLTEGRSLLVMTEISKLRELELEVRNREKLAGVGQLAAGLAHEIKNPLASLSGSIQILQKEDQSEEKEKLMEIIIRETDRLDGLLNGFLNYAKPSQMKLERTNLSSLIREIAQLLNSQQLEGRKVQVEVPETLYCDCDSAKIRQVIWNLARNAVSAIAPDGWVKLSLEDKGSWIRLSVEDNGEGIPAEIRTRIFEPFFTKRAQGTGLGLALVYQIVEAHEGKLDFHSEVGRGTCFWFELKKERRPDALSAA